MTNAAQQKDARRRSNDTLAEAPLHAKANRAPAYNNTGQRRIKNNGDDTYIQQTTKSKTSLNRQSSHYQLKELINKTVENLASKIKNCKDDKGIIAEAVDYDSTAADSLSPYSTPFKKKKDSLRSSKGGYNSSTPLKRESSNTSAATYSTTHRDSSGSTAAAYTGPLKRDGSITSTSAYSSASHKKDSSTSILSGAYNGGPQKIDNSSSMLSTGGAPPLIKKDSSTSIPSVAFTLQKKDSSITINDVVDDGADTTNDNQEDPASDPTTSPSPLSTGAVYVSTSF